MTASWKPSFLWGRGEEGEGDGRDRTSRNAKTSLLLSNSIFVNFYKSNSWSTTSAITLAE